MTNFRIDSSAPSIELRTGSLRMTVAMAEHSEIFLSGMWDCRIGYHLQIGWTLLAPDKNFWWTVLEFWRKINLVNSIQSLNTND